MEPTLTHVFDSHLDLHFNGRQLFRYIFKPTTDQFESTKPYFHPLSTLAGDVVTIHRPYDHIWHHGLAMTMAELSSQNFWGGPSYVHGEGYVRLPNNGVQAHQSWDNLQCDVDGVMFEESLDWITIEDQTWLREKRVINVTEINPEAGYWTLDFSTQLSNVSGQDLVFGSPTTKGRPLAGYGSFFWRGPRSFLNGQVIAADGLEGPEIMGQAAGWLAYTGWHDTTNRQSTMLFIDQPTNVRYPNKWFIRTDPYACVSFAFMFDEEFTLSAETALDLQYRLVIANGAWSREQIEAFVEASK